MSGPLQQLKILDFSTLLPGPYATMLLADMGAEVIRVESPTRPDLLRTAPPMVENQSAAHLMINRNKQSLALNLKNNKAKAIIYQLVVNYDIIVEQFRPGVMQRLGLDYQTLKQHNPDIIYCSITGYGQSGPLKDKAGHDINYLALSGLASYSGRKSTGPVLSATQIADIAGGSHHAVMAILAAVIERQATGQGQHLDISMSDAALSLNTFFGATALASQQDPKPGCELLNGGIFYDYYETKDARYFSVGALEPKFVVQFFQALGRPHWALRADKPAGEQQKLKSDISARFASKTFEQWKNIFKNKDCCVEPVLNLSEATTHPHFLERNMIFENTTQNGHPLKQIAPVVKFSSAQPQHRVGANLGAHSQQILQRLGLSEEEINSLQKEGATLLNSQNK